MNLEKLLEIQGGLDAHIIKQHPEIEKLENNDWKFLALQVELGELANEWRGFKVWKVDRNPTDKLLEEYVDGFHFILSIGNDLHVVPDYLRSIEIKEATDVTQAFLQLYRLISGFNHHLRKEYGNNAINVWTKLYYSYLDLGNALGFSEDDIEAAYLEKNLVNHNRQLNGY